MHDLGQRVSRHLSSDTPPRPETDERKMDIQALYNSTNATNAELGHDLPDGGFTRKAINIRVQDFTV